MSKNAKTLSQAEIDSLVQQATVKRRARPLEKTPVVSRPVTPTGMAAVQAQPKRSDGAQDSLQAVVDSLAERLKRIEDALGDYAHQGNSVQALLDANQQAQDSVAGLAERMGKIEGSMGRLELKGDFCGDGGGTGKPDKAVENQMKEITRCVQKTLGYNISKTFKCRSCAGIGMVAIRVKCTKCGKESWWGWWPIKDGRESP
jgi:hypothetical protein